MNRILTVLGLLAISSFLSSTNVHGSFVLTPASGVLNTSRWEIGGATNINAAGVEAAVGLAPNTLTSRYKSDDADDNLGDGVDSGTFAASYNTLFSNSIDDAADFTITWVSANPLTFINDTKVYLVVKDGNQNPGKYIFDISVPTGISGGWDGKVDIVGTGFWPGNGAISHIEIFGNGIPRPGGGPTIPEPASMILFMGGLACLVTQRFNRRAAI